MGITFGDHLIDSGYHDITPEQEREIEADRVRAARSRLAENLSSFDAEAAFELSNEGERADLWTEIDVNVEDLRTVLACVCPQGCYRPGDCDGSCTHPKPTEKP